jgi:glycosyltransferase involved in cell wall biosynthesis
MRRDRAAISVVCATYCGAATIDEQLASLVDQARRPAELVVVDDASEDDTVSRLERFASTAPFDVRIIRHEHNQGPVAAFSRGLAEARGQLVAFCDQDDVWYPNRLAAGIAAIERLPRPALVFSPADVVGSRLEPTGRRTLDARAVARFRRSDPFHTLMRQNLATGMTTLFDIELRDVVLPIPETWLHDSWLSPVAAAVGWVDVVPEPLVAYRQHENNYLGLSGRSISERFAVVEAQGLAHHRRQAARYRDLAERLESIPGVAPAHIDATRAQEAFWQRRASLPGDRRARVPRVLRELLLGRYHRRSLGYRSAARDLVAPARDTSDDDVGDRDESVPAQH